MGEHPLELEGSVIFKVEISRDPNGFGSRGVGAPEFRDPVRINYSQPVCAGRIQLFCVYEELKDVFTNVILPKKTQGHRRYFATAHFAFLVRSD